MRKSMEVKAVFFDIDGTLVNDSRTVLKSTEKAIQSLKEQGIIGRFGQPAAVLSLSNLLWSNWT